VTVLTVPVRLGMNCIQPIRKARGLTQAQLADLLHTTEASVSRYEREDQRLTLPLLRRLAIVLECSVADLVGEGARSPEERQLLDTFRELNAEGRALAVDLVTTAARRHNPAPESAAPAPAARVRPFPNRARKSLTRR
jgi:transcriptional regulator with XRE-family HTH domain